MADLSFKSSRHRMRTAIRRRSECTAASCCRSPHSPARTPWSASMLAKGPASLRSYKEPSGENPMERQGRLRGVVHEGTYPTAPGGQMVGERNHLRSEERRVGKECEARWAR